MVQEVTAMDVIESNIVRLPFSGCWVWMRSTNAKGYGLLRRNGFSLAHRFAFAVKHGDIPAGLLVLHRCDVRCCVNPDHLFVGTAKENTLDMMTKGRQRVGVGERQGHAKLTLGAVAEIRSLVASGMSQRRVARQFGVGHTAIGAIIRNETWRTV